MSPRKYLTADEVATILRLTPWQVAQLCRQSRIPATKPGGQWLIAEDDLEAYIAAGANEAAS